MRALALTVVAFSLLVPALVSGQAAAPPSAGKDALVAADREFCRTHGVVPRLLELMGALNGCLVQKKAKDWQDSQKDYQV